MNRAIRLTLLFASLLTGWPLWAADRDEELSLLFRKYYSEMQVDSAITVLNELIDLRHQQGKIESEGAARWNKIATLNNAARHDSLLAEAAVQMAWFKEHAIWNRYYQCWQRRCSANHDLGRLQTALREARAMHDDAQQRDNKTGLAMAYKQMGIIYYDIHQMEQATDAFVRSVQLLREDDDDSGILSGVYDGLCQTYDRRHLYEQELATAGEWLSHLSVVLEKRGIATVAPVYVSAYLAHAAAYIGLQQLGEATKALKQAEDYQAMSTSALAGYYINEMHTRLALAQGRISEAIAYTDSTLNSGIAVDSKIRELRAEALYKAGQGMESAALYRSLYEEKDSIFTRDMRSQLDEMNTLFHVDELQQQQRESRVRFILILAALTVTVLVFYILLRRRTRLRLQQKNAELAAMNAELAIAKAKAEESSKMKTEFIKNISHEIRTPLNILSGFTQLLVMPNSPLTQEQKTDMGRRVEENTDRITELVNKMLELAEASSQSVISCDERVMATEIAALAMNHINTSVNPAVEFSVDIASDLAGTILVTNRNYATRALVQLLDNAQKFTKKGSVVLRVGYADDRQSVNYVVEDTGIGIPAEETEHIFEEFVQLDDYYEGTGIGLTVARSIAQRLGGTCVLDTTYTGGSRFVLSLPV